MLRIQKPGRECGEGLPWPRAIGAGFTYHLHNPPCPGPTTTLLYQHLPCFSNPPQQTPPQAALKCPATLPPLVPTTASTYTAHLLSTPFSAITLLFFVSASGTSLDLTKNDSRHRSRYLLALYLPRYLKLLSSVEISQAAAVFQKLESTCQSGACLHTRTPVHDCQARSKTT